MAQMLIRIDEMMDDALKRREILIKKLCDDDGSFTSDDAVRLANLNGQIAIRVAKQWRDHEQ